MSSTFMLFSLVLLAFVTHVAGMREPPQAESMVETEVTLWGKHPCAQFGVRKKRLQSNTCHCPKDRPIPTNCEGTSGPDFNLEKTIEEGSNCHCSKTIEEGSCEFFGAERNEDEEDRCYCPDNRPRPTEGCSTVARIIFRSRSSKTCRCESQVEATQRLKMPVSASARPWFSTAMTQEKAIFRLR